MEVKSSSDIQTINQMERGFFFELMKIKLSNKTPKTVAKNIFDVLGILKEVGVPFEGMTDLRLQRMAQACMAIGGIKQSFDEVKSVKRWHLLTNERNIKIRE